MGKTSSNQEKKKKTKVRKLINRTKNGLQCVRKFCRQHVFPVVLSACILVGVIFGFYYKAYATGMTELYMTYWDLYNSIFASTGYSMKIKDGAEDYNNANRVTGKQAWHNFCEYVKIHSKDVYDEAVALPKFVTAEGIKMSQDLWQAAQDYAGSIVSSEVGMKNNALISETLPYGGFYQMTMHYGWGIPDEVVSSSFAYSSPSVNLVAIVKETGSLYDVSLYAFSSDIFYITAVNNKNGQYLCNNSPGGYDGLTHAHGFHFVCVGSYGSIVEPTCSPFKIVTASSIDEYLSSLTSDSVKVKDEQPPVILDPARQLPEKVREDEYIPWLTWADLDAKMREATNDNEDKSHKDDDKDDNDKDKNGKSWKDIIPALIPFNPKTPSTTEKENDKNKDTEKSTESDSKKNPMINPDTGRYIDPDTGYDIDPDTGKLIDPDTGELIEPDIPSTAGKAGNWKRLFPFCIPWDMMELIKSMQADKKAPVFEFKYTFKAVNYTWVVRVDMSDYWKYIKIFRWGMTIFFIIGLFFLTVKFTTFVQRMGG